MIVQARDRGVAVILVTHNAHHALTVGDRIECGIEGLDVLHSHIVDVS